MTVFDQLLKTPVCCADHNGNDVVDPRANYTWFWCAESPGTDPQGGSELVGTRWNTTHLTVAINGAAHSS